MMKTMVMKRVKRCDELKCRIGKIESHMSGLRKNVSFHACHLCLSSIHPSWLKSPLSIGCGWQRLRRMFLNIHSQKNYFECKALGCYSTTLLFSGFSGLICLFSAGLSVATRVYACSLLPLTIYKMSFDRRMAQVVMITLRIETPKLRYY